MVAAPVGLARRVQIRRRLTDTPLARQHDRLLDGRAVRKPISIPWTRFRRADYPEPALALAQKAQTMLATGEYEAVDLFSRIASGLAINGAPIDLVAAATRVVTDEVRHSDYAFRMATLCGAGDVAIEVRSGRIANVELAGHRFPLRVHVIVSTRCRDGTSQVLSLDFRR